MDDNLSSVPLPNREPDSLNPGAPDSLRLDRQSDGMNDSSDLEWFTSHYSGIPIPTYLWKRRGDEFYLLSYNNASLKITNGKIKDFVGWNAIRLYGEQPGILADLRHCYETCTMLSKEMPYTFVTTGETRILSVIYVPLEPDLIIVHTNDITDLRRAEENLLESEEKYRILVEMFPHTIAIFQDHKAAFANRAAARMLGFDSADKIVGLDVLVPVRERDRKRLEDYMSRRTSGEPGLPDHLQTSLVRSNGTEFPVTVFANRIIFRGRPALQVVVIDITEQEKAAAALRKSELKYRTLIEQINAITYSRLTDGTGNLIFISPQVVDILGYSDAEVLSVPDAWIEMVHPDDRESAKGVISGCRQSGQSFEIEYRMLARNGKIVWLRDTGSVAQDESAGSLLLQGVILNITRLKETEETLKSSETRYQELFNSALEGIGIIDENGILLFCNPSMTGIADVDDVSQIIGKSIYDFVQGDQLDIITEQLKKRREGQSSLYELDIVTAQKNKKSLLISSSPRFDSSNEFRGSFLAIVDISQRKEIEQIQTALYRISEAASRTANIEELLHTIRNALGTFFDTTNFHIALWNDNENSFTFPYYADSQKSGPPSSSPRDKFLIDYVRRTGQPLLADREALEKLVNAHEIEPIDDLTFCWLGAPLKTVDKTIGVVAIQTASGPREYSHRDLRLLSIVSSHIAMAIERKRADNALRESEERFRAIWENSPVGVCLTDREGVYHYVNKAYCDIYGYTREELMGRSFFDMIMPPGHLKTSRGNYPGFFDNLEMTPLSEAEVFVKKSGEPVVIQYTSDFLRQGDEVKYMVSMNIDITDKRRALQDLKESEEKYRLLIENAGEVILTVNTDGRFLVMNKSAARYLGGVPTDFVGRTLRDVFPKDVAEGFLKNIQRVAGERISYSSEVSLVFEGQTRWFKNNLQPVPNPDNSASSALIIAADITAEKTDDIRNGVRLMLLKRLRKAHSIDECLLAGCRAISDAQLFKRAVLTLHDENRTIINLGQVGLDEKLVDAARQSPAPRIEIARKMTQEKYRISHSYFIPEEEGIFKTQITRYIPSAIKITERQGSWMPGDELFVPIVGSDSKYEGWLSVDTPFDGRRPSTDTVLFLEEILDITSKQVHEIRTLEMLKKESQALKEKNITLKEVLSHIEEDKMEIRQKIGATVAQVLLPALNRLIRKDGSVNQTYLNILKSGLPDLIQASGASIHMYSKLSPREREICNMIKNGASSKEIAAALNISLATVRKHREFIRRKLGISHKDINLTNYLKGN